MAARQHQAHRFRHAPGTNMADSSPRPNAPTMLRELTWPVAALGSRIRACPGKQHGRPATPVPQLPPSSENQHGEQQNLANSSCNAPGANMAGGSPGPTAAAVPWESTWPPGHPGPTALAMPWEPTRLVAALGSQLPPCSVNQHGHPAAVGPKLSSCPVNRHGSLAALDPQLPPCPGNQHGRLAAPDPQLPPYPRNENGRP